MNYIHLHFFVVVPLYLNRSFASIGNIVGHLMWAPRTRLVATFKTHRIHESIAFICIAYILYTIVNWRYSAHMVGWSACLTITVTVTVTVTDPSELRLHSNRGLYTSQHKYKFVMAFTNGFHHKDYFWWQRTCSISYTCTLSAIIRSLSLSHTLTRIHIENVLWTHIADRTHRRTPHAQRTMPIKIKCAVKIIIYSRVFVRLWIGNWLKRVVRFIRSAIQRWEVKSCERRQSEEEKWCSNENFE